jgi:hypothetical protein
VVGGAKSRRGPPSFLFAVAAAAAIGVALTFAGPFEYRCTATLRIGGEASAERCAAYRKELLDYLWERVGTLVDTGVAPRRWLVDSPAAGLLRICVNTSDRKAGVSYARSIADGYCNKMQALSARTRTTPTEAEGILAEYLTELQTRLSDAQSQVDAAIETLPQTDPSEHRDTLVSRWKTLRSNFAVARQQLAEVSAGLDRVRSEPEPTHGMVTREERASEMAADEALQQDLRELAVNLTELKAHLLGVWRQTGDPLGQLTSAVGELIDTTTQVDGGGPRFGKVSEIEALAASAQEFRAALTAFAEAWNSEFAALAQLEVDPLSGEGLDIHQHLRRRLNDYLFGVAKRLAAMRLQVQAIGADSSDTARHHVFLSNLMRAFQTVQAAHHRFEFAAGSIETPDNFRIDAALTSARGLRRRSQDRIHVIEERLQERAAERTRKRRLEDLTNAEQFIAMVRTATDKTVDDMVALQEELNLGAAQSEAFLRAVLRAEVATSRLELVRNDLGKTEDRLRELSARRTSAADAGDIEVVSYETSGRPVNLNERLRIGGIGAVLALVTVLFGQWWIARRG